MNLGSISSDFAKSLVKAQSEIEGAKKGSANPAFRSKYSDLGDVWDACRDALHSNGIAVLQFPTEAPAGNVGIQTCLLYGPTGELLGSTAVIPFKDPTNPQAAGSAYTYLRRYALSSAIGICPVDDDGNKASEAAPLAKAKPQAQQPVTVYEVDIGKVFETFKALNTTAGMKEQYRVTKESNAAEPGKTQLLTMMANHIKGLKAEGTK